MSKNSIQVAIKVRPLLRREKDGSCCWRVVDNSIQLVDAQSEPFYFDHIFDQDASNDMIFEKMAKHIVHSGIRGFNGTIFAYGQTSSGKTYTMMGDDCNPGVMVLAAKEIFKQIEQSTDRQFLLRVGYIEIYNEKIYDLLNKKNQDLKIHENATGIVSVNCEENIITCEDDLLYYLSMGNKERTVGETNMNERSSRSHAIFRIIIESRKTDRSEDDAVIQSVLNLVDLAGSERADQTGARGTRLKEGGHINKSLLFLSNVIKRLSENEDHKFISYRDSKLTRILQASLGGNALTSIICTIKPSAVEETQSTLSFAMRAKTIKNKPEVNEIVSEATMMKRLEREIKDLKTRLAEERQKNESQIKVGQLEQRIKTEVLKIITCNSLHNIRTQKEKRRRTWCAATSSTKTDAGGMQSSQFGPLMNTTSGSSSLIRQQYANKNPYCTPLITMRNEVQPFRSIDETEMPLAVLEEEVFEPGELCDFENIPPPVQDFVCKTPKGAQLRTLSLTPKATGSAESNLQIVENALLELQEFTNLENKMDVKYDTYEALKQKVDALGERNKYLEEFRLESIAVRDELIDSKRNLANYEKRCIDLNLQVDKLTHLNEASNSKITAYENQLTDLKGKLTELELQNREIVSREFEFETHRNKAKQREAELLELITEKGDEILRLENTLKNVRKSDANSPSHITDNNALNGNVCSGKCKLADEYDKIKCDFENLHVEYEKLKINHAQVMMDAANDRMKLAEFEKSHYEDRAECNRLQDEINTVRTTLEKFQDEYKRLQCDTNEKTEACTKLNEIIATASEEMRALQERYDKLEDTWKEQQQFLADIQAKYDVVQMKYQSLQTEYEKLEQATAQPSQNYTDLQKENENLQSAIGELKSRVKEAQNKLQSKENDSVVDQLNDVTSENVKLKEELKQLELQFNAHQKELNACFEEAQKKLQNRESESVQFTLENAKLREELKELQQQFDEMQKEYDDLSNQLMDSLQESETLRCQVEAHCQTIKSYEEKTSKEAENKALREKLEEEIAHLKMRLSDVTVENNKDQKENVKVKELTETVNDLTYKNECLSKLLESTEKTIGELRDQINILSAELLEKSQVLERCACEDYQKQIEQLERTLAEKTICGEDQELEEQSDLLLHLETNNTSCMPSPSKGNEKVLIANDSCQVSTETLRGSDEIMKELEAQCRFLEQSCQETESKLVEQESKYSSAIRDLQAELTKVKEELSNKEKEYNHEKNRLQLELYDKLEQYENEGRENLRRYNRELEANKDMYESTIASLRDDLNKKQLEVKEVGENIRKLEVELKREKEKFEIMAVEKKTFLEEREIWHGGKLKLEEENSKLKAEYERITEEKTVLLKRLDDEEKSKDVEEQLKKFFAEKEHLKHEVSKLEARVEELNKENMDITKQWKEALAKREEAVKEAADISKQFESQVLKNNELLSQQQARKETIELKLESLSQQLHEANLKAKAYDELVALQKDLENQLSEALEEKEMTMQKIKDLEVKLKEALEGADANIVSLREQLSKANEENASIQQEKLSLQSAMDSCKNQMNKDKHVLERSLSDARGSMEELKLKLEDMQLANEKLRHENESLELRLTRAEEQNSNFEKKSKEANSLLDVKTKECAELKSLLDSKDVSFRQEREKLEAFISGLLAEKRNLETNLDALKVVREQEQSSLLLAQKQAQELKVQLQDAQATVAAGVAKYQLTEAKIAKLGEELSSSQEQNVAMKKEKQNLYDELATLKDKATEEKTALDLELNNLKHSTEELQLKLKKLQQANIDVELKLKLAVDKNLKNENALKESMSTKKLLDKKTKECIELLSLLNSKEASLKADKQKLEGTISCLLSEKKTMEDKIVAMESIIKKMEVELAQKRPESVNNSMELNTSNSPRSNKSAERLMLESHHKKPKTLNFEEKLSVERKNRRLSTHDERRQSFWEATCHKSTMTDPSDTNCNCIELDKKLKECEKNLFIRESQVTVLNLKIKNHPLKMENAMLKSRLQEEQDRCRIEIKRYKQMLHDQASSCVKPKQKHVETQTELDIDKEFQTLKDEYTQLTVQHTHIQQQCDIVQKELQTYKLKYEDAKKVLYARRKEIERLGALLNNRDPSLTASKNL